MQPTGTECRQRWAKTDAMHMFSTLIVLLCGRTSIRIENLKLEEVDMILSAAAVRFSPIICLKTCICFLFFVFPFLNPFKGTIAFEYISNSGAFRIASNL